jgi:hypothetical protein
MMLEDDREIYNRLGMERVIAGEREEGYGYVKCTREFAYITKVVAQAANEADLGNYRVTVITIPPSSDMKPNGIKVVDKKKKEYNDLIDFWGMVDYVEEQLSVREGPVNKKELEKAVAKTIEDKKSGVFDEWLKERIQREDVKYDEVRSGYYIKKRGY